MTHPFDEFEPVPDHLADTGQVQTLRDPVPAWRRTVGLLSLLGAVALTIATIVLLVLPADPAPVVPPESPVDGAVNQPAEDAVILDQPSIAQENPETVRPPAQFTLLPTLDPETMAALLATPVAPAEAVEGISVVRNIYNPFTIVPDRPRSEVIEYEVQAGDTIFTIAERFGLKPETIAWSNDRSIIGGLRPGRILNILPVDGAYWAVPAQQSIAQIARQFNVDPYVIIDSEFNALFGSTPETVLPSGTRVIVPGGEAERIAWNPVVQRQESSSGGGGGTRATAGQIIFEPGDPGSCGWTDNPGGSGAWTRPMRAGTYQWSRGFTSWHTGVDLAAPEGTPVLAANGGTVIFAGWNSYGYGYAVVLAHGPYTTVYAHLSSINVGCRQYVQAGSVIGGVGATGQATGPHLHFEIRYNDVPQDPTFTMPF